MTIETGSNTQERGWVEILRLDDEKLKAAIGRVNAYRNLLADQYQGVTVTQGEEWCEFKDFERVIGLRARPEELKTAPTKLRKVFKDIGLDDSDPVSLRLTLPPSGSSFKLRIEPDEITDDKIGITLSSNHSGGELIAPAYNGYRLTEPMGVKEIPFFSPDDTEHMFTGRLADKVKDAYMAIGIYSGHTPHGWDVYVRTNPRRVNKIMTSAGNWVPKLLDRRRKPQV